MPDPIVLSTAPVSPVIEAAPAALAPSTPPAPAPAAPVAEPAAPAAPTPSSSESLEDAITRRLGLEKPAPEAPKVEPVAPAAEAAKPAAEPDEAALAQEIAATTEKMSKEQREAFTKKTYELRDYKRRVKEAEAVTAKVQELEAQLKAAQEAATKTPTTPPDYDSLKTEVSTLKQKFEDADKELAATRLEKSDLYKREIGQPLDALTAEISALAKRYNIKEAELVAAVTSSDDSRVKVVSEVASEMAEYDRMKLFRNMDAYDALKSKRDGLMANAQASLTQMTAAQQAAVEAAAAKARADYAAAVTPAWDSVANSVGLQPVEGNTAWNTALADAQAFPSKYTFEAFDTQSQASIMARASVHPLLVGTLKSVQAELAAAKETVARLRGATPAAGGGAAPAAAPTAVPSELGFEQAIAARMAAAGLV